MRELGIDNFYIELYENFSCENIEQLLQREGEIIRLIGNLNKRIAGRTHKEYKKEYRENNKDKINEYKKEYRRNNKDKINEYRENNKDKIKEINKEYRENNKEKLLEQKKQYRENNKDKIK